MKRLLAILLAVMTLMAMTIPAMAADGTYDAAQNDYGTIPGTTTTLKKQLWVDADANIPTAEFNFTVSAGGTAAEVTDETQVVFAGITPYLVKVNRTAGSGRVSFTAGETATNGTAPTGANSSVTKYAETDITLDFTGVTFDKPGVYRYLITETDPTSPISAVGQRVTTVDVYVNDKNGTLEIASYVAYDGEITDAPKNADASSAAAGTKDNKFINQLTTYDLKVDKVIVGNQGDKEDEFAFKITIENLPIDTVINTGNVDIGKNLPSGVNAGTTTYTASGTTATINITLGHNDQLVLTGIPTGATYTVVETAATGTSSRRTSDGYTVTGEVQTATTLSADASATVTNTRNGVIPTGVAMGIGSAVILVGVAAIYFATRRKLSGEEE